ncbi:MAG: virulence RhuM family protein, partial [Prevotellaceae bacterium]|nr:virulence RhuM family protein [Prevotellaceae bacterium]
MVDTQTYQLPDGTRQLDVCLEDGTVWLTIDQMAMLYGKSRATINEHILNIFNDGELVRESVVRKIGISDFSTKPKNYYSLDLILSVGYRVKSPQTAPFRGWATEKIAEQKAMQVPVIQENTDIVFYSDPEGKLHIELTYDGDTFWITQKRMSELFSVEIHTINYHLTEIFNSGELNRYS